MGLTQIYFFSHVDPLCGANSIPRHVQSERDSMPKIIYPNRGTIYRENQIVKAR